MRVAEICAGAGGQAIGLELAGFEHAVAVEFDKDACATLRLNRPAWDVREMDLREFDGTPFRGVELLAGGVPCQPFSDAGLQHGQHDERDMFPEALRLVREMEPRAVMLENVKGLLSAKFAGYRAHIIGELRESGYDVYWKLLTASSFGVPQLRPRAILVALRKNADGTSVPFSWPAPQPQAITVGEALLDLMSADGWEHAVSWAAKADDVAPTLVGGSKRHGGADLGPTRARRAWLELGVDARSLAETAPPAGTPASHTPKLTVRMAARIQGFPDDWQLSGRKTAAYRQVGNAFPPPVACAVGNAIRRALED